MDKQGGLEFSEATADRDVERLINNDGNEVARYILPMILPILIKRISVFCTLPEHATKKIVRSACVASFGAASDGNFSTTFRLQEIQADHRGTRDIPIDNSFRFAMTASPTRLNARRTNNKRGDIRRFEARVLIVVRIHGARGSRNISRHFRARVIGPRENKSNNR